MCGAKVSLKVVAESGKYHSIDYPPITKRSVKLQIGESAVGVPKVTPKRKVAPKTHSPKKITSPIQKAIINLPGKIGWLVGCFGFNGPLRQYFSLYRAVSQRGGERREKR